MRSPKIALGVLGLAAAVAGAWLVRTSPAPATTGDEQRIRELEERLALVEQRPAVERVTTHTRTEQVQTSEPAAAAQAEAPDAPIPPREPAPDLARMSEDEREDFLEARRDERAVYRAILDDTIDRESIDGSWAPQLETTLEQSLASLEMPGLQLADLECRTSFCRVEIALGEGADPERFMHEITTSPGFDMQGLADLERDFDGTRRAHIYLAREGASFPEDPAARGETAGS